jgi:uncharacterized protein YcbX
VLSLVLGQRARCSAPWVTACDDWRMGTVVGHVAELWRYPVKSLGGEQVNELELDSRGVVGDRWWAVRNAQGTVASGKTTSRFARVPNLLTMSSYLDGHGVVWARSVDGRSARVSDPAASLLVSEVAGEPVTLAEESDMSHFDDMPVHMVTSASLQWLARQQPGADISSRRVRPNIVINVAKALTGGVATHASGAVASADRAGADRAGADAQLPEEGWCGAQLRIGTARFRVDRATLRCVMTTMAQPGLAFVPRILKTLEELNGSRLGVYAEVLEVGTVSLGDEVWMEK